MEKVQTSKPQSKTKQTNWKPFLQELGSYALRGFVTGVSVKLGGMAFDKTFKSNDGNLTLIKGGRSVSIG